MKSTSEIILDSVITLIKTDNISEISMNKIALLSDIGKSTIYEYFSNKEEMIYYAICKMLNDYIERILSCNINQDFKECFYEHVTLGFQIGKECSSFEKIFRNASYFSNYKLEEFIDEAMEKLKLRYNRIAEKGFNEGILNKDRLEASDNYFIAAMIEGVIVNFISKKADMTEQELIDGLYKNVVKIINN